MLTYLIDTFQKTICINTQKRHLPKKVSFAYLFLYSCTSISLQPTHLAVYRLVRKLLLSIYSV